MKKYLGIDYGTKRIGLAIGDDELKTAVIYGTVNTIAEVADVVQKEEVNGVVVGVPYSVADQAHTLPEAFQRFAAELKEMLHNHITVHFTDERLSSKYADSLAGDKKTKAGRDEVAAVAILQGYFDALNAKY